MRIFVIAGTVPFRAHGREGVTAAHILLYALVQALLDLGHEICLQLIFNPHRRTNALTPSEFTELQDLSRRRMTVLPPLFPRDYLGRPGRSALLRRLDLSVRLVAGSVRLDHVYPAVNLRDEVRARIDSYRPNVILTVWSPEGVAATHGLHGPPRIAYQGDLDFVPYAVRLADPALFADTPDGRRGRIALGLMDRFRRKCGLVHFRRAHLRLMRDVSLIANVTASNAEFYTAHGHPRAVYIRNAWPDPGWDPDRLGSDDSPPSPRNGPVKIIGHVGYLNRTGSTYGLRYLLRDVMPALEGVMRGVDYQIHIIGGGEAAPSLRRWLRHERIVMRGFVQDLDSELKGSDMMLLLNNAGPYQAAYTRHLVAWSMGLCLIVHADSRKAIPEIAHMENALVGSTPSEIAELVYRAASEPAVNRRVRAGGRATYEKYFTPREVAKALTEAIARVWGPGGR